MPDIFITYARADQERAGALANLLERQGWSVWWDPKIPPGRAFDEVIEEALDSAKCVIVLWSKNSVTSQWVKTEASEGKRRNILVPALIDSVDIPLEFRRIQAAHLNDWQGIAPHPEIERLFKAVSLIIGWPDEAKQPLEISLRKEQQYQNIPGNFTFQKTPIKSKHRFRKILVWSTPIILILGIIIFFLWMTKKEKPKVQEAISTQSEKPSQIPKDLEEKPAKPLAHESAAARHILATYQVDIYFDQDSSSNSTTANKIKEYLEKQEIVKNVVLAPRSVSFLSIVGTPSGYEIRYDSDKEHDVAQTLVGILNKASLPLKFEITPVSTPTPGVLSIFIFSKLERE